MTDQLFCTQCGQANMSDARFCLRCGEALFREASPTNEVNPPPYTTAVPQDIPPVPIGTVPDFIALRCSQCGGELKVAPTVRQLTCLNCGTVQDVVMENGGPVLNPLLRQLEQVGSLLDQENANRQNARFETGVARFQTDSSAVQILAEQDRQARLQEILLLEQHIRDNEGGIKELGSSQADVKGGYIALIICIVIGAIAEILLVNLDPGYDISPFTFLLLSIIGVFMLVGFLVNSASSTSREGSRLRKENEEMRRRILQLRR